MSFRDTTYGADQIIGKTLFAKQDIPVFHLPYDSQQPFDIITEGQPVGVVDSYLNPAPGRSNLWWMFYDTNEIPYYAPHQEGVFDTDSLEVQGAMTTEQIHAEQEAEKETTSDKIFSTIKTIGFWGGLFYIGGKAIQSFNNGRSKK